MFQAGLSVSYSDLQPILSCSTFTLSARNSYQQLIMSESSDDGPPCPDVALVRDGITGKPTLTFQAFTKEDTDIFERSTYPAMRETRDDDGHERCRIRCGQLY